MVFCAPLPAVKLCQWDRSATSTTRIMGSLCVGLFHRNEYPFCFAFTNVSFWIQQWHFYNLYFPLRFRFLLENDCNNLISKLCFVLPWLFPRLLPTTFLFWFRISSDFGRLYVRHSIFLTIQYERNHKHDAQVPRKAVHVSPDSLIKRIGSACAIKLIIFPVKMRIQSEADSTGIMIIF